MSRNRKGVPGRPVKPLVSQAWEWAIDDYLHVIAAEGQREATRKLRRDQLRHMARGWRPRVA
jgi:hypothetical protein